jgi:hypothetical protein
VNGPSGLRGPPSDKPDALISNSFLQIVQSELGLPSTPTEATVRFTWVPSGGTCPAADARVDSKAIFEIDARTNVYILVGGHDEVRRLETDKDRDEDY